MFLPLDASGASCNGQNSVNPAVKQWFLRFDVFQTAIDICAKTHPKCSTKASTNFRNLKNTLGRLLNNSLFAECTFQQMCLNKPSNKKCAPLDLLSLLKVFSDLAGPCRPDPPKRHLLYHLIAKIRKIIDWFTIWYVFASFLFAHMRMRMHSCAFVFASCTICFP